MLAWLPSYFRDVQSLSVTSAGLYSAAPWLTMFVMINISGWVADGLVKRGNSITFVRKLMQTGGMFGSAVFFLLVPLCGHPPDRFGSDVWRACLHRTDLLGICT